MLFDEKKKNTLTFSAGGVDGDSKTPSTPQIQPEDEQLRPQSQDGQSEYLTGWHLGMVIGSLYLGTFLMALDTNIINVAIPSISYDFQRLEDITWYGSAYLVTITAFQPIFGTTYKFFKIVYTYQSCIAVFEVGSIITAAAVNSPMFIFGRAVSGVGAAGLLQGSLTIIGQTVEFQRRPLFMGIVISVFAISNSIGPIIGGVLTQRTTWRWCFWINVPIGAVVLVTLFFSLRTMSTRNERQRLPLRQKLAEMDPIGSLVFLGAVVCLLLALQWGGQERPWSSPTLIGLFVGAGLLTIVFVVLQWKLGENATITLRVFCQRSILFGSLVLFCLGASLYILSFYLPFWFQAVQGVDVMTSGIRYLPLFTAVILFVAVTGGIVTHVGYYVPFIIFGELVCIAGIIMLTKLSPTTTTVYWAAAMVVTGIGLGMAMQLPYTAVQCALSPDDVPIGNAISVFIWQLGGAVAIAVGQNIALNTIFEKLAKSKLGISPAAVTEAGATNIQSISSDPHVVQMLRHIWNLAISRNMVFALAMLCASVPAAFAMEWLNTKQVSRVREDQNHEEDTAGDV